MPVSPEVPAWINYLFVTAIGAIVAVSTVNRLLDHQPERWAFAGTWSLVAAHMAIPPLLFWFLDFTEAIHDTSLFVAIIVGFGYRQVFAGGIEGITLKGQTSAVWKPFESWVESVIKRISAKVKQYRDRFDMTSKRDIARDSALLDKLQGVALAYANDPAALQTELDKLAGMPASGHRDQKTIDLLWERLRQSQPTVYGRLLGHAGVVPRWKVWWWFDKGRSRTVTFSILLAVFVVGAWWAYPVGVRNRAKLELRYYHWRMLKSHATDRDRHWAVSHLTAHVAQQQLQVASNEQREQQAAGQALRDAFDPLFDELTFAGIPEPTAERVLSLFLQTGWAVRDDRTVRRLIDTLWTPSSVARARINRTLVRMQEADYKAHALPPELVAPPQSGEAPEEIDRRVRRWREWWTTLNAAQPPAPPVDTPAEKELEELGRHIVQVSFENNSAELREDVPASLEELRTLLDEHPSWTLRIEGHTDDVGTEGANLRLSRQRAETISRFLTDRGIAVSRLEVRPYGESVPLVKETTPEARARNRRVELLRTDGEFARRATRSP